jgi:5-methylcytosine-specific restriction protein A
MATKNKTHKTPKFARSHAAQLQARVQRERIGTAAANGYGYRWQQARIAFLQDHPLCAQCQQCGRATPATVVDHIAPHRGDMLLFWDRNNWQPLCASCHGVKSHGEMAGGAKKF